MRLLPMLVLALLVLVSCVQKDDVVVALDLSETEVQLDDVTASYQVQVTNSGTETIDVSWDIGDAALEGEGTIGSWGLVSLAMDDGSTLAPGETKTVSLAVDRLVLHEVGTVRVPIRFYETGTNAYADGLATLTVTLQNSVALNVPDRLDFGGSLNMIASESETILVEAFGAQTFDWTITSEEPWVEVSPSSGSGTTEVTVMVNRVLMQNDEESACSGGTYSSDDPDCVRRTCFSAPLQFSSNVGDVSISVKAELQSPCE